ncbi:cis-2,3-dihydrobiphenyl-2,3-diol dehydrogenase [Panacagrimonas perspica]|uniref:Cis-2,3-dihydrobiphenyl-2,3-diol dehydrogenase n=1 Tax=Panacagrimonas perspica TaxID=381431 RepID=A0A4R7NXH8_9GAMM|nr:3-(cis-5,6-dihydroxycyclohexa-1,3-dien-1-yl)propanoate dehydrogenase [Panacagrimonas perspica]TDU25562.1 cis-2,3-dihydrobiphenyl-2,3-diol dehydrogenase [Panacagrimonas perspica]THD03835.1 3-(cis-5,6-dihydroxycyclohexa-1,3-dien-1-yl)propanoate dehydrogenase [Panacagrimonas perspica]
MNGLKDAVVLITGGGSGLGRALVERFLCEGARVAVLESSAARASSLRTDFGEEVEAIIGDVTVYADNARAVERTVARFGRLDTFIANAGVFDFFQALPQYEGDKLAAAFDELFAVNVKGGLLGARAALSELVKARGSIIFTISNAGFYPGGGGPLYTASKHALVGLVKQLAHELAPKVRVNGVAPGGMSTNLSGLRATGTAAQSLADVEGLDRMLRDVTPLQVSPKPKDYCGPYVLLASATDAGPITGAIINTDGGLGVRGIVNIRGGEAL